ncbi:MAG TPA: ABC transporter ATP-binding protein [Anaerolineaceae bacterium]
MHLQVEDLSHVYLGKMPRPALANLTFEVPAGQFVALVGPSGCGKSTLLRLAAGLLGVQSGSLLLDGLPPGQNGKWTAWMAQNPALLPWLTVEENLRLAGKLTGQGRKIPILSKVLREALQRVGLGDALKAYPHQLSGGMQQRAALARLLIHPAELWLMDEPFAALDELTRERLAEELLDLWQPQRPTVLWVTHNIREALLLADRILVLTPAPGEIAADIAVALPRPRQEDDPGFLYMVRQVRTCLEAGDGA